ncbi:MAG: cyclic nucleotide-binding domain-containing protein [Solobacterium sp.]|nr:cyclic nucleotide-binding domain-containing protein [Solobacterium sp.]
MEKICDKEKMYEYLNDRSYRNWFPALSDDHVYLIKTKPLEKLIGQGDEADTLYYLVKGRCRVSSTDQEGKTFILNIINAPNLVGEIELITEDVSFSIETIDSCILIALPYAFYRNLLLNDNTFLLRLCELLTEKEREHALKLAQVSSFPLENRLAAFILENSFNDRLSLKKTIIAQSLGVSYRHLEKVMKDFVEEGILKKDRFVYTITNKIALIDKASVLDLF